MLDDVKQSDGASWKVRIIIDLGTEMEVLDDINLFKVSSTVQKEQLSSCCLKESLECENWHMVFSMGFCKVRSMGRNLVTKVTSGFTNVLQALRF